MDHRPAAFRAALSALDVDRFNFAAQFLYRLANVDERRSATTTGMPLPEKLPEAPAPPAPSDTPDDSPAAPAQPAPQAPAQPAPAPTPDPAPAPRPQPTPPQPPPERFRSEG